MIPRKPVQPLKVQTAINNPVESPLAPSQPVPAEHPSAPSTPRTHSSRPSKEDASPRKVAHARQQSTVKPLPLQGKSASLSVATAPKPDAPQTSAAQTSQPTDRSVMTKNANMPPPNEPTFLTALAAQERHVLELKEELAKAEENLGKLKKQWVAHEARKRQIESRGIHRMTSTASRPPGLNNNADPTLVGSMYKDMAERKATIDLTKGGPRRRYFSGSRHIRSLSLVSPDTLRRYADSSKPIAQTAKRNTDVFDGLTDSPTFMPPTPDLIKEEEEDTEPSTNSQRSSRSPQRDRMVRSSVQMASEFREGLWTFFEDLKHATYGDDARGGDPHQRQGRTGAPRTAPLRQMSPTQSPAGSPALRPTKYTVRRQTWQIRPNEAYNDAKSPVWGDRARDSHSKNNSAESNSAQKPPSSTPLKSTPFPEAPVASPLETTTPQKIVLHEREVDGEKWQTWDTPTSTRSPARSDASASSTQKTNGHTNGHPNGHASGHTESESPTMPAGSPRTSNSSSDATPRPTPALEPVRDSIPWPALNKLRPGHLRKTASNLMDEWEKSLVEPKQRRQTGLRPPHRTASPHLRSASPTSRSASPRPQSARRANSRLDVTYS